MQKQKKKQVVLYRINILLFNKDIYVIRNFALGRCWPEKSRFLCDLILASPGALNLLWKEVAVTLTTGEWGLWCGKGVHCVVLDCVELFLSTCFRCYLASSTSSPMRTSACLALEFRTLLHTLPHSQFVEALEPLLLNARLFKERKNTRQKPSSTL